ncbi:hypothetical protein ACFWPK_22290 [Nocardia sp. NPDC058519]|uniref:hypothetical protein n=1 Tax=Nocardia sp. NPDC058519 TaxID=3346535 RepID=UPI00364B0E7D
MSADHPPEQLELIEDDTSDGGKRRRRAVFPTEAAARQYMDALTKVGALWIKQDWGWRSVPRVGPIKEVRRLGPGTPER